MSCDHDMANGTCSQCDPYVVQNIRDRAEKAEAELARYRQAVDDLDYELGIADAAREASRRGGQHTNGPSPRFYSVQPTVLSYLRRLVRDARRAP